MTADQTTPLLAERYRLGDTADQITAEATPPPGPGFELRPWTATEQARHREDLEAAIYANGRRRGGGG